MSAAGGGGDGLSQLLPLQLAGQDAAAAAAAAATGMPLQFLSTRDALLQQVAEGLRWLMHASEELGRKKRQQARRAELNMRRALLPAPPGGDGGSAGELLALAGPAGAGGLSRASSGAAPRPARSSGLASGGCGGSGSGGSDGEGLSGSGREPATPGGGALVPAMGGQLMTGAPNTDPLTWLRSLSKAERRTLLLQGLRRSLPALVTPPPSTARGAGGLGSPPPRMGALPLAAPTRGGVDAGELAGGAPPVLVLGAAGDGLVDAGAAAAAAARSDAVSVWACGVRHELLAPPPPIRPPAPGRPADAAAPRAPHAAPAPLLQAALAMAMPQLVILPADASADPAAAAAAAPVLPLDLSSVPPGFQAVTLPEGFTLNPDGTLSGPEGMPFEEQQALLAAAIAGAAGGGGEGLAAEVAEALSAGEGAAAQGLVSAASGALCGGGGSGGGGEGRVVPPSLGADEASLGAIIGPTPLGSEEAAAATAAAAVAALEQQQRGGGSGGGGATALAPARPPGPCGFELPPHLAHLDAALAGAADLVAAPLSEHYAPPPQVAGRAAAAGAARRRQQQQQQQQQQRGVAAPRPLLLPPEQQPDTGDDQGTKASQHAPGGGEEGQESGGAAGASPAGDMAAAGPPGARGGTAAPEATQGFGSASLAVFGALPPGTQAPYDIFFTQPASQM
jgi:hypothetical protein